MTFRHGIHLFMLAALAIALAGCAPQLPREWREAMYGPDATPTQRVLTVPTAKPSAAFGTPTPPAGPTRLATLTPVPTRTATVTRTATATPSLETLTLQQGAPWFMSGQFVPYGGTEDTTISAWNRTTNYAEAATLSVRQGDVMASLIYFHLGDLPLRMPIVRAEMSLYVSTRSNDTPMSLTLRSALKPWILKEATWLKANNGLLWQTPGAHGETDRVEQPVGETVVSDRSVWLTFDLTDLVRAWLKDPQANQGLLISGDAPNAVQYDFTSADSRDERHRPRLTLTLATGTILLAPLKVPTATVTRTPTIDPLRPEAVDVMRLLPLGSTVVARALGDLDGSGLLDIVAAYRMPGASAIHVAVFKYYGAPAAPGDYRLAWSSPQLGGALPVNLDLVDITGDRVAEILVSVTSSWTGGRMLFVFVSRPADYRLALPVGGYFSGKDYFGESGYDLADVNNDGRIEISARHGNQVDVYAWDGVNFTFVK